MLPPHPRSGSRPGVPSRPAPRPANSLLAEQIHQRLRQAAATAAAATRYDLSVLRLGGGAPPTLPRAHHPLATVRDGDLARLDAQQRYAQLLYTCQQQLAQLHQAHWQALLARQLPPSAYKIGPAEPASTVGRELAVQRRIDENLARMTADNPEAVTIGQGVRIGLGTAASGAVSELAAARLVAGLRWAGATRAAVVVSRMTWAGAEEELLGARAGWQGYQGLSAGDAFKVGRLRLAADLIAQGGASYITSEKSGFVDKSIDALSGVNLIESGMAVYGLRPVSIGIGSAFFQFSAKDGFQSPLNHKITWQAFGAQAAIGTGFGYLGQGAEYLLTRRLAYGLYRTTAQRLGHDIGYPVWFGSYHFFTKVVPSGIGITEEHLENQAQDYWPAPDASPAPDTVKVPKPPYQ